MVFGVIFQNNARTLRERGLAVYSAVAYLCREAHLKAEVYVLQNLKAHFRVTST